MLTSFPWYNLPSVAWANDALWRATGFRGRYVRGDDPESLWRNADLLVTQACGLDLYLCDAPIEPAAAPVFDLPCEPGTYFSYLVGSTTGTTAAVNSLSSRSGWSALLTVHQPERVVVTGSHLASLRALRTGTADVAAIDAVTWHILARDMPEAVAGIAIIERTAPAPSPPYVVRRAHHRSTVTSGLRDAIRAAVSAADALLLRDVMPVQRKDYAPVLREYQAVTGKAPDTLAPRLRIPYI